MKYTEFLDLPKDKPFARGMCLDNPDGLNMTNSNNLLRWVAIKGWDNDWCIYTHFAENDWDFIQRSGDKVCGKENILKLVPCDSDMFAAYRY